jgi:hypothetical protein
MAYRDSPGFRSLAAGATCPTLPLMRCVGGRIRRVGCPSSIGVTVKSCGRAIPGGKFLTPFTNVTPDKTSGSVDIR